MVPGISKDERSFVANGLRARFNDISIMLFEKAKVEESLASVTNVFNILVYVIGAIALVIAFFLLLIATTQNVKEAVWEYGVLRSMGITMAEG